MNRSSNLLKLVLFIFFMVLVNRITIMATQAINNPTKTLYVSTSGNNQNIGSFDYPFKTVQHAINSSTGNTKIVLLPGVYRESFIYNVTSSDNRKTTIASTRQGSAAILGSESSNNFQWKSCDQTVCTNIAKENLRYVYYADLPWDEIPQLLVEIGNDGTEYQLPKAREPDFKISTDWKYHEYWWTGDEQQSSIQKLKDSQSDYGLEPGNLTTVGNLKGAKAYIIDGADRCGGNMYISDIVSHDRKRGEITFKQPIGYSIFDSQEAGIGSSTKYYVEGKLHLLDSPGEWFYDEGKKRLYLRTLEDKNPVDAQIEIARKFLGITIKEGSHLEIKDLDFKYFNYDEEFQKTRLSSSAIPQRLNQYGKKTNCL